MFKHPSLIMRITYGKILGFVLAGAWFLVLPDFFPELGTAMKWGFVLYYTLIGAMVGFVGIFTTCPVLGISMPWWCRGPMIGACMDFILMLFIYDQLGAVLAGLFGEASLFSSPLWLIADGAAFGLFADFICTKFAGEGPDCVSNDNLATVAK